jgi:hypothetical protein
MGTDDEQPSQPSLEHEVLRESVGQHGPGRRRVDHVGSAVFLAKAVVDRPHVEEHEIARSIGVGYFEQRIGGKIDDEK